MQIKKDFVMEVSVFLNDILFVIVLYRKKPGQSPALQFVLSLGEDRRYPASIFIYDNSPDPSPVNDPGIFYRHDACNSGVSKAYNEAAVFAKRSQKKWLFFLDQDTHPDKSSFLNFLEMVSRYPREMAFVPKLRDRRGVVSPFRWSAGKGNRVAVQPSLLPLRQFRFMNSGLLVRLSAFEAVGGYDETIPLDFSDIAFAEKLMHITDHFVVVDILWHHPFSGTEAVLPAEAIHRFDFYCIGSFRMGKTFGHAGLLGLRAMLRSINLSLRYRRLEFIRIFLKHASHG